MPTPTENKIPQSAQFASLRRREEIQSGRTKLARFASSDQMRQVVTEELHSGVLAALYDQLFKSDGEDQLRETNQFVAWVPGGFAVAKEALRFTKGLAGESALDRATSIAVQKLQIAGERISRTVAIAENERKAPEDAPDVIAALAEAEVIRQGNLEVCERMEQAVEFANLLNQIPDVPAMASDAPRAAVLRSTSANVMDIYVHVLRCSETASYKTSAADKAKVKRLRALFFEELEEQDIITGERLRRWRKTRLINEYERTMHDYETAKMEFQMLRSQATSGVVPGAAMRFATQGAILRNRVRFAMDQWNVTGRKNDVERVVAYLESQGMRDASLIRRELLDKLRAAKRASPRGGEFCPVTLAPASFVDEETGWMKASYSKHATDRPSSFERSPAAASADSNEFFGLIAMDTQRENTSGDKAPTWSFQAKGFDFTCEYAVANIERGAVFDRAFLTSRMLRLPSDNASVCDGSVPPKGEMPALPTKAIFVRNLRMNIRFAEGDAQAFREVLSATGSGGLSILGFGGFQLNNAFSNSLGGSIAPQNTSNQALISKGMQLVGLVCDMMPACPVPLEDPNLTWCTPVNFRNAKAMPAVRVA